MLSGLQDEVVPKEQMSLLFEAIAKRGERRTSGGKEYKTGTENTEYKEFPNGGHSKVHLLLGVWGMLIFRTDDTCVQHGYWTAIANFIARLSPSPVDN